LSAKKTAEDERAAPAKKKAKGRDLFLHRKKKPFGDGPSGNRREDARGGKNPSWQREKEIPTAGPQAKPKAVFTHLCLKPEKGGNHSLEGGKPGPLCPKRDTTYGKK